MPPSLFLTEGFVPEELLEEEKKRTQTVLDEGIQALTQKYGNLSPNDLMKLSVENPVVVQQ